MFVQVLTGLFFVATGCATKSGQSLSTSSTGAPYNGRTPTRTLAEPSGIGRQHVQNIGKLVGDWTLVACLGVTQMHQLLIQIS